MTVESSQAAALKKALEGLSARPRPFEVYTARELWTDPHTSARMLAFHLNKDLDVSSRKAAFIRRSAAWLVSHFGIGPGTSLADYGCGPGLYTLPLARTGATVTGLDFSPRSIEYARAEAEKEGLAIRYELRDYLAWVPEGRFDLILLIMGDFCALGPAQRQTLLANFSAGLKPGGAVLLDVYSLTAFAERTEQAVSEPNLLDGFWSPGQYHGFLNTFKYDREKAVLDKYTIVEAGSIKTVYNWLQYFSPESLTTELAANGFAVTDLWADVAGAPFDPAGQEFAVVMKKAG